MKEITIRKKVIEILINKGYVCWYPPKVRYKKETDIFGCWDLLAINKKNGQTLLVQFTTLPNIRAREKKVKSKNIPIYSEVWGWDKKNNKFKIIPIYGTEN